MEETHSLTRATKTILRVSLLLTALLLIAPAHAFGQAVEKLAESPTRPLNDARPFKSGETLTIEVTFSKMLVSGVVGEIRISATQPPPPEGSPESDIIQLHAEATSRGFFPAVLKVRVKDSFDSVVRLSDFALQKSSKRIDEGKVKREEQSDIDHEGKRVTFTARDLANPKAKPTAREIPCANSVQDLLSVIYFVRTLPLREGDVIPITLYDAGELFEKVEVAVGKQEEIKTNAGRFKTVRLIAKVFDGRFFKRPGELVIWLTDDSRRLPIRARARTSGVTVTADLKKVP
jgi:uncharacterized protein DUF3108